LDREEGEGEEHGVGGVSRAVGGGEIVRGEFV
jgi:hypothetical protein